jgi:hypothetical protein
MTKLFVPFLAAAFVLGLSAMPTLTYAQDDPMEDAEGSSMDSGDDSATTEENTDTMDEAPAEDSMEESEDGE